jgi:hypothetical protein
VDNGPFHLYILHSTIFTYTMGTNNPVFGATQKVGHRHASNTASILAMLRCAAALPDIANRKVGQQMAQAALRS